jgi:hypothetical protein
MVLAREVEDKRLAPANKPSRTARRIVRVENEREKGVGRFGAMSSNSWVEVGILALAGAAASVETGEHQSTPLGTNLFRSYKTLE